MFAFSVNIIHSSNERLSTVDHVVLLVYSSTNEVANARQTFKSILLENTKCSIIFE